jgi:membrane-associated phospholipid phosphatase
MEEIRAIEIAANIFLQSLGPWLQVIMKVFTNLGSEIFFILVMPAIYWCVDAYVGLRVGVMLLLSGTFNNIFKLLFRGPRPYWISDKVTPVVHESSFGIPSGHAMNSATVWGWMAVEAKKRWSTILALVIIFLIGFSRLVMGVHFLSDVLLGWLLGGILVLVFAKVNKPVGAWLKTLTYGKQILLAFASSTVMILLALAARSLHVEWQMPVEWAVRAGEIDPLSINGTLTMAGTWFGMLGGFAWLRHKYGIMSTKSPAWKLLIRYLVGLAGVLVIYLGLGQLFSMLSTTFELAWVTALLRYIRYSLIGLWVSLLAPLLFKALKLAEIKPVDTD